MADLQFKLNGAIIDPIKDWEKLTITATFDRESTEANISTSRITFYGDSAKAIRDYRKGGLIGAAGSTPGITEGPTLSVTVSEAVIGSPTTFDFIVDMMAANYEEVNPTEVRASLRKVQGVGTFQERANATTFLLLHDKGAIQTSDFKSLPYITEREPNGVDIALASLTTTMLVIQLISEIRTLHTTIVTAISKFADLPLGPLRSAIWFAAIALIQFAFVVLLIVQIVKMVAEMIALLISPVKFHKIMLLKDMLSKGANYLGYGYNTSISTLDDLYYLPSKDRIDLDGMMEKILQNIQVNQPGVGIPAERDDIYTLGDAFRMCNNDLFYAQLAIKNNTIEHHALNAPWWTQQSSYTLPNILDESFQSNAHELKGTKVISFKTDPSDWHTIKNYDGTAIQIHTEQVTPSNVQNILIKGLDRRKVGAALVTRKTELNLIEKFLKSMAEVHDKLLNYLGGDGDAASKITARVGMVVLEKDQVEVGRLMRLNNSLKLDQNYRANFGAPFLYNNYHNEASFVSNSFGNQYTVKNQRRIEFGYADYLTLLNNNYLTTDNQNSGKITKFVWTIGENSAVADYRIKEPWSNKLTETIIIP